MEFQVAAFECGKLRLLETSQGGRETVMALPLNRLLVKMVKVPAEEDPVAFCEPLLKAQNPFPDDPLTVSCETVREDESGKVVIVAALPEGAADDIGEALDAAKLTVVRVDALVLGQLRGIWGALGESAARRALLLKSPDCLSIVVLDGDQPSAIRAITDTNDLRRELMLSLLEAEDFGGARKLGEIVVVESGESNAEGAEVSWWKGLESLAPVRAVEVGADAALAGVAERVAEEGALNALPASWAEMLEETRFKRKLTKYLVLAGGLWLLVIAVMFGVPFGYGFATDYQKKLSKRHARQYAAVKEMKEKVDLIHKYSDHARGALEILKAVSDRLPEGVTLTGWDYKREEGVRVTGESETSEAIYSFKDAMDAITLDGEGDSEKLFKILELNGPNSFKGGFKFSLDCQYAGEGEE